MKKTLLSLFLIVACSVAYSQITYNVKAGILYPRLSTIFLGDEKISFYPEVGATFKINQRACFSAGLGLKSIVATQEDGTGTIDKYGTNASGDTIFLGSTPITESVKSTLTYLSIPLYFSYVFDSRYSRSNRYVAFDLGLQPNINVFSKIEGNLSFDKEDVNPFVADIIFGIRVGATMLRDREVEFGFRYCRGLQDLVDGLELMSDAVALTVGMNFNRY